MDLFTGRLPPGLWKVFRILSRVLGILFFAAICWNLWVMGDDFVASGEGSTTLQIPLYPVAYAPRSVVSWSVWFSLWRCSRIRKGNDVLSPPLGS